MEQQKNYHGKKVFFIELLIVLALFPSCQKDGFGETREFLHGTWAREGFTNTLRQNHNYKMALESMNDTIGFIHIDPCFGAQKGKRKWCMDPFNPDSLTDEERDSTNSIWFYEDYPLRRQHAFRLFYKGDDYFLSEPLADGERKYCKIISGKDNRVEYGLMDKDDHIKASLSLELLYRTKKWCSERFREEWAELYVYHVDNVDFILKNFMYGVKSIKLYKSASPNDSLLHTYSNEDIKKEKGIRIYFTGDGALVEHLQSGLKPKDETDDGNNDCFFLTWRGDTAILKNNTLDGDYYMVLTR